jgi:hypothetical protein
MKAPPGKVFADRYKFISLLPSHSGSVTAWRAIDAAFDNEVVVYFLDGDFPPHPGQIDATNDAFARAGLVQRSGTIRWHSLDLASGLAVREWVNGFTLHDLLRRRRKLSVSETLSLLGGLPDTLDAMCEIGITPPGDLLRDTWVAFEADASDLLNREPALWPRNLTKLPALRLRDFWQQEQESAWELTQAPALDSKPTWVQMARLLRELFGARIRDEVWMPLPALNETANQLLRDTLGGKEWKSARDFWEAFKGDAVDGKSPVEAIQPVLEPLSFQVSPGSRSAPCRVAALVPREKGNPSIHLCAGTEFRFGRSSSLTEFPTVVAPETLENKETRSEIGRVHARLEARDGTLWLRDGNGEAPSRNGTEWDGIALPGNTPVALRGRGVLDLAHQYKVALMPVMADATPVIVGGIKAEHPLRLPWCAVIPTPMRGFGFVRRSVWIMTTLGFDLDKDGDVEWHRGGYLDPSAMFVRAEGGFWLANIHLPPQTLQFNDVEIPQRRAVPILDGLTMRIGDRVYDVKARS